MNNIYYVEYSNGDYQGVTNFIRSISDVAKLQI